MWGTRGVPGYTKGGGGGLKSDKAGLMHVADGNDCVWILAGRRGGSYLEDDGSGKQGMESRLTIPHKLGYKTAIL